MIDVIVLSTYTGVDYTPHNIRIGAFGMVDVLKHGLRWKGIVVQPLQELELATTDNQCIK